MRWKKFTIETTSQAEDLVCGMLTELGVEGVEIEDRQHITPEEQEQMHIGFLPELPEDDGKAYISFYIEVHDGTEPAQHLWLGQIEEVHQRRLEEQSSAGRTNVDQNQISDRQLLAQIREKLREMSAYADVGTCQIIESVTEDADWINNWKQYFRPFMVDDVLIRPSWYKGEGCEERSEWPEVSVADVQGQADGFDADREEQSAVAEITVEEAQGKSEQNIVNESDAAYVIEMDPGTAFGTGMHESTQLILRQLKKYVTSETKILDVGCGSGILSILALKLGAAFAAGIDIEEEAVNATAENMAANGIPRDKYKVRLGNLLEGRTAAAHAEAENGDAAAVGTGAENGEVSATAACAGAENEETATTACAGEESELSQWIGIGGYDLVVANILAGVVIALTPVVGKFLKKGGLFITSGILCTQEEDVRQALLENGFDVIEITRQNDWVSLTGKMRT